MDEKVTTWAIRNGLIDYKSLKDQATIEDVINLLYLIILKENIANSKHKTFYSTGGLKCD